MSTLLTALFGPQLDRAAMWTASAALVALIGVLVAWRQLARIRATSQADFTFRFIEFFFTADARIIYTLLENSALEFDVLYILENGKRIDRLPSENQT